MITLTVRHTSKDPLAEVWSAVSRGWHRVTGGKAWVHDKEQYKVPGWVKAVEVTHGKNGWHVHLHTVIAYKGTSEDAESLGQRIYGRWESGLRATKTQKGFTALPGYGMDVEVSEGGDLGCLGRYLSKLGADLEGLSREVVQGAQKDGRSTNRTPFQIARDLVDQKKMRDKRIWKEWQEESPGHRALTWAKGFRERFSFDASEATDEEIAAEETGTSDDTVCLIPSWSWKEVAPRSWQILEVAENYGVNGLLNWLGEQKIDWKPAPDRFKRADDLTREEIRAVEVGRNGIQARVIFERTTFDSDDSNRRCFSCGERVESWLSEHVTCRSKTQIT